jgi:hypothetical protein
MGTHSRFINKCSFKTTFLKCMLKAWVDKRLEMTLDQKHSRGGQGETLISPLSAPVVGQLWP